MAPKVGEAIRRLQVDGWVQVRVTGSHRVFKHPTKPGIVVVAGKPSTQLPEGTWHNMQRQAGWRP